MSERKGIGRAMYPMNWPDYLFRIIVGHYEAVYGANRIIAVSNRLNLQWR